MMDVIGLVIGVSAFLMVVTFVICMSCLAKVLLPELWDE